ncbi:MAG TPA: hypothetical protein VHV74_12645 [Pseudonocardiaceae bacterium]|jgi:hypothetical protein|nr:hypothetical protein [Pseudonocardiaceae bacterium]
MPSPSSTPDRPGRSGTLGVIALFLLPVLCCGVPVLLAAGTLATVGSWLRNPWLIGAAALLVATIVFRRARHRRPADQDCCPPRQNESQPPAGSHRSSHPPENH